MIVYDHQYHFFLLIILYTQLTQLIVDSTYSWIFQVLYKKNELQILYILNKEKNFSLKNLVMRTNRFADSDSPVIMCFRPIAMSD